MKFIASIEKVDGSLVQMEHESRYDATSILVEEIEAKLEPGDRIAITTGTPRSTYVPAISRIREARDDEAVHV